MNNSRPLQSGRQHIKYFAFLATQTTTQETVDFSWNGFVFFQIKPLLGCAYDVGNLNPKICST